jgi:carboxyl-terminal processing protease
MKRIHIIPMLAISLLVCIFQSGCKKDNNNQPGNNTSTLSPQNLEINEFIWSGLHNYYLWVDSVPDLSNSKFSSKSEWDTYLNGYSDHEKLFYDLLYKYQVIDKWSWIVDDYKALLNQFQGITLSMGYDFRLVKYSNSDDVFGFVRYVDKGSPADLAGIKRGDIFVAVNGTNLSVDNYQSLLIDNNSYTLSLAYISNNTVIPSGVTVSLNAVEVHENPIYLDTILNVNNTKIGYLVYNGFMSDYDIQLNEVFQYFKNEGIQKLILDLRYNPGGSVQTAIYMASMIYSTDTNKVFLKSQFNTSFEAFLNQHYGGGYFISKFADRIEKTDQNPETFINSLNLNQLYVITTDNTASASELIINGLNPYLSVSTIGTTTVGKYVGSMTILDYDANGNLDTADHWALQPIVLKISNSIGYTDYVNGFAPTDSASEDIANLLPFGDPNETLLKTAIDYIEGNTIKKSAELKPEPLFKKVADSKDFLPHNSEMYIRLKNKRLMRGYH